ncbi:MAG: NADH-quinone oxidoreductase subunit J [bacterium]
MTVSNLVTVYFALFTVFAVLGALGVVLLRNIFHSALSMIVCLFAIAGYFVLLNAEFLAMVQVVIYVGAIMVLIIFAILLSQKIMRRNIVQTNAYLIPGAIASAILFGVTAFVSGMTSFVEIGMIPFIPAWFAQVPEKLDNTTVVGWSLMSTYSLPFEIASVLLLMALIGSIVLAKPEGSKHEP